MEFLNRCIYMTKTILDRISRLKKEVVIDFLLDLLPFDKDNVMCVYLCIVSNTFHFGYTIQLNWFPLYVAISLHPQVETD